MTDAAELIHDLIHKYGRWLDTGKHNVDSPQRRAFYEAQDRLKAALTPQPSAEDEAVLDDIALRREFIDDQLARGFPDRDPKLILYGVSEFLAKLPDCLARMAGKVPTWQPIESAPKNNSSRLVWCPLDKCIYCVTWVDNSNYPPARSGWQVFGGNEIIDGVTHWMPLPAAPEAPR